jgi:hypothetical protein
MQPYIEASIREKEAQVLADECRLSMDNARAIVERMRGERERVAPAIKGWQIGPIRLDNQISMTGVISVLMILGAMMGGWFHFNYQVTQNAEDIAAVKATDQARDTLQTTINQKVSDALSMLNFELGQTTQELHDMKEQQKK